MNKKLVNLLIALFFYLPLMAEHIKGGEMGYRYLGTGGTAGMAQYEVSLKLYIDCNANNPGQLDNTIPLTVFDKVTGSQYGGTVMAGMSGEEFIRFDPNSNPCIGNPPNNVCYRVRRFTVVITLPINTKGYTIAYQRCCRIGNIINLNPPSNAAGATYTCEIPGSDVYPEAYKNNSPVFVTNDAAAICANSSFTFSFAASETDGDSLVYQMCGGFQGGSQSNPAPSIAAPPPYFSLVYEPPFAGNAPLGANASINSKTGLITGIAPGIIGQYVITACAYEYRNGVLINIHRKDIHVAVSDCIPLKAQLKPNYSFCDDFLVTFRNEQINPPGSLYIWQYGDNTKADTTNDAEGRIQHQFADTGSYKIKLKVILAGQCVDSTTTIANVFPGYYPGFVAQGTCILLPLQFTDTTKSRYGVASKWRWNFGDETTLADTSHIKNPNWKYSTTGFKSIELIVESNKGCIDTVVKEVEVRDKPPIQFPFADTLICSIDTLQLHGVGNGIFSWGPAYNILNANSADPLVFPKQTTWYKATLNENGCVNTDSVQVRVVDFVTLFSGPDTTVCATDTFMLNPQTDGLKFLWSPATYLDDPTLKNPLAHPPVDITYTLHASIGKCFKDDALSIRAIPYPLADAGGDTIVCYGDRAFLHASIFGSSFSWSPTSTLSGAGTLDPIASPLVSTEYTLRVFDTLGCPKPGIARVLVTVRPDIIPFAGNDTAIVIGQPLQLHGTGADLFEWTPPAFLNDPNAQNPIAVLNDHMTYIMRTYTPEGCSATDTINVRVFKTKPDIFVPNAFAPNGKNRVLRPIPVGISTLKYFRVFNRWGQLVFQTSEAGKGWDGTINGKLQDTGTYAWMVEGVDFTGKVIFKRGTSVLVR